MTHKNLNIVIIGLGYVGLPLAIALAKRFNIIGFDINGKRIEDLKQGYDYTNEIDEKLLLASSMQFTNNLQDIKSKDVYIVTVPTPITPDNLPDLKPLEEASKTIGGVIKTGAIIVYECTVYPGITEDHCGPILEKYSNLKSGKDFFLGYSPERINPGDKKHTVEKITKVVAAQTPKVTEILALIYGSMNNHNIFIAKNIKTAEAAKVIENTQRDINIAFINEISIILHKMGISIYDVLAAAKTKWNFLDFKPGLVGGHCIGVDPYYLAYCATLLDYEPKVILAGRRTNDSMGLFIAQCISDEISKYALPRDSNQKILILGLTFKEDVPDIRNSKVVDLINHLKDMGYNTDVYDPVVDNHKAQVEMGLSILPNLDNLPAPYAVIVGAVRHQEFLNFNEQVFNTILCSEGIIIDFKHMWSFMQNNDRYHYWSL